MKSIILSKTYPPPPFCEKEILRYANCKNENENIRALVNKCINEIKNKLTYRVCYGELPIKITDNICDFETFSVKSEKLAFNLKGAEKTILFAATIGTEIDRIIIKYGRLSPVKSLIFHAIGTERIEALCDAFCADIEKEYHIQLAQRFSPGYSDLPLSDQKNIFAVLEPEKRIGLTLNDSFVMSPSKSVTAFIGLNGKQNLNKCSDCNKLDCTFRGV